jgi:hypothetical protein
MMLDVIGGVALTTIAALVVGGLVLSGARDRADAGRLALGSV